MAVMTWPNSCSLPAVRVLLLLSLATLQVCAVYGSYQHTCTLDTRSRGAHPNGICGKNLAQIVSILCTPRGYVSNWFSKRSAPNRPRKDEDFVNQSLLLIIHLSDVDEGFVTEKLRGILLNKKEALSYLHKREPRAARGTFGSQGITCECCYNRCTYYELLHYCN